MMQPIPFLETLPFSVILALTQPVMAQLAQVLIFPVALTLCKHLIAAEFGSLSGIYSRRDWRVGMYKSSRAGKCTLRPEMVNPAGIWALNLAKSQ